MKNLQLLDKGLTLYEIVAISYWNKDSISIFNVKEDLKLNEPLATIDIHDYVSF
jgi:hypothetical protein